MTIKASNPATQFIVGDTQANMLDYTVEETPDVAASTEVSAIKYQTQYDVVTPSSSKNNAKIDVTNAPIDTIPFGSSSNEDIATVDGDLNIIYVSDGDVEIYIEADNFAKKRIYRTMLNGAGDDFVNITGYEVGSLAKHILDTWDTLISGLSPSDTTQKFWATNNADPSAPSATMNANLFAAAYDFSGVMCMATKNGVDQSDYAAPALVTNRHALVANHVNWKVGDTLVFKNSIGGYETVTISARTQVSRYVASADVTNYPDIDVLYLSAPLSANCKVYKTMPEAFADDYLRSWVDGQINPPEPLFAYGNIPCLRKARHSTSKATMSYLQSGNPSNVVPFNDDNYGNVIDINNSNFGFQHDVTDSYWNWGIKAISGDSGSPSFFLLSDGGAAVDLVLLCSQRGGAGSAHISEYTAEIEAIMTAQAGSAQTLSHPDLSAFTTYP